MTMSQLQRLQQIILLSGRDPKKDHYELHCLNQFWYQLLVLNTYNDSWKKNVSDECQQKIIKYFKNKDINL